VILGELNYGVSTCRVVMNAYDFFPRQGMELFLCVAAGTHKINMLVLYWD
jgi:hypothetical protein